jgi:hypothetical protein
MSTELTTTAQQIIDDAYTIIRVKGFLDPLENEQVEFALRMLNSMLKQWEKDACYIHVLSDITIALNGSKQSYTIGPSASYDINAGRPLKLVSALRRDSNNVDTPVKVVSLEDYRRIPQKGIVDEINTVAYERSTAYGIVYVWPVNDEVLISSTRDLVGTFQRPFDIFDTNEDTPDLPAEMFLTVTYGLAAILVNTAPLPMNEKISLKAEAMALYNTMKADDGEKVSFFFKPSVRR